MAKPPSTAAKSSTTTAKPAVAKPSAPAPQKLPDGSVVGVPQEGERGIQKTTAEIMREQALAPNEEFEKEEKEFERYRPNKHPNPDLPPSAASLTQYPPAEKTFPKDDAGSLSPQTPSTEFTGATLSDGGLFPPDTMGAVGPTQFFAFVNNRLRTFNKTTGAADGVLNATPNTFFTSVRNGSGTSDPRIRYDRLTQRWILVIINVAFPNRFLVAVSDAASNGIISATTVWTFFSFNDVYNNGGSCLGDYPTLGVDANALYIGTSQFCGANINTATFKNTTAYVVRKSSVLGAGPIVVTTFDNLMDASFNGPFTLQGVDNYDAAATTGLMIAVDGAVFSRLRLFRVSTPGATPTITATPGIAIDTPAATTTPLLVPHMGNTGGTNGQLDGLDDRLFAAHVRNGILWTAHNIGVNSSGTTTSPTRNAARWYAINNVFSGTPSFVQSGTVFDNAASNPQFYWIPSIMVSGQGHAALGFSLSAANLFASAATVGRLRTDTLGTTKTVVTYESGVAAYNPSGDSGGTGGRRWGDYSYVSLDPCDDMTMWTIQEFTSAANIWGTRAVKLLAPPPPATVAASPNSLPANSLNTAISCTGTSVPASAGQEFYDPGAGFACRLTASVTGPSASIVINSVTYVDPTHVNLNISIPLGTTTGSYTFTLTNPDGQTTTFSFTVTAPTEVKLDAFRANGYDDGRVLLQWQTGREADNLGFNIYREENGLRAKVTPTLVAGSALLAGKGVAIESGQAYSWTDVPSSHNAKYWLEDIDLSGKSVWHGPFTITSVKSSYPSQQDSDLLSRLNGRMAYLNLQGSATLQRNAATPSSAISSAAINPLASQNAWKISVSREGWYRISQRQLAAAGFDASIDPRRLQVFADGQELAVTVAGESDGRFDADDYIEFYGLGVDTPATNSHIYWLTVGNQPGKRIQTSISKPSPALSDSYAATVERRDHSIYFASLKNGDAENFFGAVVSATPVDQTLTLRNINRKAATATLEVSLQGVSQNPHQVAMALNGTSIGKLEFSDQTQGVAHLQVPVSLLRDGENVVNLSALNGATDVSLVAAIRITYQHNYVAENNSLRFTAAAGQSVTINGFSNTSARVFDVTDPNNVQEVRGMVTGGGTSSVTVTPQGAGQRVLLALTSERADSPDAITANSISNWRSANSGADLVILTRRDFSEALATLKALRESQGLNVAVVDIEDIYDEFNFGTKSVQTVKDFFAFAKANWQRPPRFVLLAGDASFDPHNYLGFGDTDIVPTRLLDTAYLEAGSDDWLVDFDGDGIGDIAIGRLPARSLAELANMTAKIVRYEKTGSNREALLVSDNNDGFNFDAANAQLKPLLPSDLHITELQRSLYGDETRNRLLAALNAGAKIVNYAGHGSVTMWRASLLTADDARSLTNDQTLSVFVTMTCLNGYFDNAAGVSLAASLMKARGGAVAVWSSTALTLPSEQTAMNQEFYRALFNQNTATLGEAIRRAKAATDSIDVRRSWTFFGDPAMRLR